MVIKKLSIMLIRFEDLDLTWTWISTDKDQLDEFKEL